MAVNIVLYFRNMFCNISIAAVYKSFIMEDFVQEAINWYILNLSLFFMILNIHWISFIQDFVAVNIVLYFRNIFVISQ